LLIDILIIKRIWLNRVGVPLRESGFDVSSSTSMATTTPAFGSAVTGLCDSNAKYVDVTGGTLSLSDSNKTLNVYINGLPVVSIIKYCQWNKIYLLYMRGVNETEPKTKGGLVHAMRSNGPHSQVFRSYNRSK
jgi:hypothetical protein